VERTRRDAVKDQHGFATWPGADAAALERRFLPDIDRIPNYSHEARTPLPNGAFIDHLQAGSGAARISVRVVHYPTVAAAHEGLVDILEVSMAPQVHTCAERGLALGDPCFCDPGEPAAFVAFARANVLIRVDSSGPEPVSVAAVATELDRQLAEALQSQQ
jgi:hypothetical protein